MLDGVGGVGVGDGWCMSDISVILFATKTNCGPGSDGGRGNGVDYIGRDTGAATLDDI